VTNDTEKKKKKKKKTSGTNKGKMGLPSLTCNGEILKENAKLDK
jgi:hypothetical protein